MTEAAPVENVLLSLAVGVAFAATYLVIAVGRAPGLRLDRAGAALVGASVMTLLGAPPFASAASAVDFPTLTLLLGMMIIVANLRLSGFFAAISTWAAARARKPIALLAAVSVTSGALSAFLVNDAVCVALTPLVLDLTRRLGRNPVPYLLATAMASNVGSTATITGNPQNMIIGGLSHIPYGAFAAALAPVAAAGLALTVGLIAVVYRSEFLSGETLSHKAEPAKVHWPIMAKSVATGLTVAAAFFAGAPPAQAAILGAAFLLLTRRIKSHRVYAQIDWTLLLMFAGLFIVTAGAESRLVTPELLAWASGLGLERTVALSVVTAALSNIVSNVPAVLALKPFIAPLADQEKAWLTVAMASTLAGNFTVLGSVANLIVVERARAEGVRIGFWEYFTVGAPLTALTIGVGVWWLG